MDNSSRAATRPGLVATIVAALVAGGLAGAGVAMEWYPPVVGVLAAAAIGVGVGMKIKARSGGPR
jgi:hypothetical protein